MRVNVTYSVDLNEVKQLVEELLLKVEDNLENINKLFPQISLSVQNDNEKKAAELIGSCRENIASLDHSLFDCHNIINGYQQTQLQIKSNQFNNADGVTDEPSSEDR
tara:strand:+ start:41098 stop:41418 length:321 start_codon:yes stop_codon:yes gene_type:complete